MIYTFRQLYEQVAAQNDERTSTGTTRDLVKEYLNQAHANRCLEFNQVFLVWDRPVTLTTVVGQRTYPLHQLFDRPLYFYNRTTQHWLSETPNRTLSPEQYSFNDGLTGPAKNFMFWGHTAVKTQPTAASVVTLVSTHTGDTGSTRQVAVKGMTADGDMLVDVIQMDGLTPVAGTIAFEHILAITKSAEFDGTITATANSGAVTLLTLSPSEFGRQYRQIYLLEEPTAAETIEYRFYRKPLYLVNDYDVPDIPGHYAQILVYDALLLMAAYNTDTSEKSIALWSQQKQQWERALADYVAESQTMNSRSRYVRETENDHIFGRGEDA
jgi:hypothetical protein